MFYSATKMVTHTRFERGRKYMPLITPYIATTSICLLISLVRTPSCLSVWNEAFVVNKSSADIIKFINVGNSVCCLDEVNFLILEPYTLYVTYHRLSCKHSDVVATECLQTSELPSCSQSGCFSFVWIKGENLEYKWVLYTVRKPDVTAKVNRS